MREPLVALGDIEAPPDEEWAMEIEVPEVDQDLEEFFLRSVIGERPVPENIGIGSF